MQENGRQLSLMACVFILVLRRKLTYRFSETPLAPR